MSARVTDITQSNLLILNRNADKNCVGGYQRVLKSVPLDLENDQVQESDTLKYIVKWTGYGNSMSLIHAFIVWVGDKLTKLKVI